MAKIVWTEEKIQILKDNYFKLSAEEISKLIGCSIAGVFQKAFKLGLKGRPNGSWNLEVHGILSKEQEQFLIDNYPEKGPTYCSEKLNIKYGTIQKNAHRLKVKVIKRTGSKHHAWKGGFRSVQDKIRTLSIYWKWHKQVTTRDNHICQKCGTKENLQVHHMKTLTNLVKEYCIIVNKTPKELMEEDLSVGFFYELSNGVTFCETCHKDWHKTHGR